jgi:hypothetical protein
MFAILQSRRFERALLDIGPEPAGYNKRREYDQKVDKLVDQQVFRILAEVRRQQRYRWAYDALSKVKELLRR